MNIKNEKALYEASLSGDVESVRHLLENEKVNINWRNPGEYGRMSLHKACINGQVACVALLLQRDDVDVNAQDYDGQTALHHASFKGHAGVVRLLLQHEDTIVNIPDLLGATPLTHANQRRRTAVIELLRNPPPKRNLMAESSHVVQLPASSDNNATENADAATNSRASAIDNTEISGPAGNNATFIGANVTTHADDSRPDIALATTSQPELTSEIHPPDPILTSTSLTIEHSPDNTSSKSTQNQVEESAAEIACVNSPALIDVVSEVGRELSMSDNVAALLRKLIEMDDGNFHRHRDFKERMQRVHDQCFSDKGKQILVSSGKSNIIGPFMLQLKTVIEDAIEKLEAYSRKGFLRRVLDSKYPSTIFADIESSVMAIVDDMSLALQISQFDQSVKQEESIGLSEKNMSFVVSGTIAHDVNSGDAAASSLQPIELNAAAIAANTAFPQTAQSQVPVPMQAVPTDLDAAIEAQNRVERSKGFTVSVTTDDVVATALALTDVALEVGQDLPMVGSVATLLRKLIEMYDAVRCSKEMFKKFKERMQRIYTLYFSEEGQQMLVSSGKSNIIGPFMLQLKTVIDDAVEKLGAYSRKGFMGRWLAGSKPEVEFNDIDSSVTTIINDMSLALQISQRVAQMQHMQATLDIQQKIDELGGLKTIQQDEHKLQLLSAALGVDDISDLRSELADCLSRLEAKMDECNDLVKVVRDLIVAEKGEILGEMKKLLATMPPTATAPNAAAIGGSSEARFEQWKLTSAPVFERTPDSVLGAGSFGKVYSGRYRGKQVAIKVFIKQELGNMDAAALAALKQEINVHLLLASKSRQIVDIVAVSLSPSQWMDRPCIVMEKALGSLYDLLHAKNPRKVQTMLQDFNFGDALMPHNKIYMLMQLSSCMEFIVSLGLLHRDIKSSNILLFENLVVKLCDFGFATMADKTFQEELNAQSIYQSTKQFSKGTPLYMAPETEEMIYCEASDVYSFGVLLQELMTGNLPHAAKLHNRFEPVHLCVIRDNCCAEASSDRPSFATVTNELKTAHQLELQAMYYGTGSVIGAIKSASSQLAGTVSKDGTALTSSGSLGSTSVGDSQQSSKRSTKTMTDAIKAELGSTANSMPAIVDEAVDFLGLHSDNAYQSLKKPGDKLSYIMDLLFS